MILILVIPAKRKRELTPEETGNTIGNAVANRECVLLTLGRLREPVQSRDCRLGNSRLALFTVPRMKAFLVERSRHGETVPV